MMKMNKKKVIVIGAGESGFSAIRLLLKVGADVRCYSSEGLTADKEKFFKKEKLCFSRKLDGDFFRHMELAILSPGVKPESRIMNTLRQLNIPTMSEIELASGVATGPWMAVTGSNGKTTTSSLLGEMIRQKMKVDVCGNIGKSFARSILEEGSGVSRVVEISSFQIHQLNLRANQFFASQISAAHNHFRT